MCLHVYLGAERSCVEYSVRGLVEGDEAGEVARTQFLTGHECHIKNRGFYAEGTGEPWKGFEERRDRVRGE